MQNQSQSGQSRERKRAEFSAPAQSKNKSRMTLIIVALLVAAGVAYLVMNSARDNAAPAPVASSSEKGGQSNDIRIPLAEVTDTAKFFDFKTADNSAVRFFALRSSDGVYRVALNACDTCYHAKKGYHQQGDDMICNNCGLKFPSAKINEVHGGCNPISLPRAVEGDSLVIKASDLESRKQYF
jgi:uncharacterized membrane protein